MRSRNNW